MSVLHLCLRWLCHGLMAAAVSAWSAPASHCAPRGGLPLWQGVATHDGFARAPRSDSGQKLAIGVNAVRDEVFWAHVQPSLGEWQVPEHAERWVNDAVSHGIEPFVILGYGHPSHHQGAKPLDALTLDAFKQYALFIVRHFRGRVRHYEVWNEWDADTGGSPPGEPQAYVRLLRHVVPALREADPSICIVAGSALPSARFNGWLDRALRLGLLAHADALSLHTYNYGEGEGRDTPERWADDTRWFIGQRLPRYPDARGKPVLVTEMGWSSHAGGLSEQLQAAYALRLRLLAIELSLATAGQANPLAGLWWYDWQDDGEDPMDPEHHYGLLDRSGQPKPAWRALAELQALWPAPVGVEAPWRVQRQDAGPGLQVLGFTRVHDHAGVLALWHGGPGVQTLQVRWQEEGEPRFSAACQARAAGAGLWQVQAGAIPCLVRVSGPGPLPQVQRSH